LNETLRFLIDHGYTVLFIWIFAEQIGLPLPATPLLLAAGALAGQGELNFALCITVAVMASLASDTIWYQIGRVRGGKVLNFLCRVSLEPDSCVRKTETSFERNGARSLLIAKFVPGLNTMAPPLAGIIGMRLRRFLLFDALGALLYIGSAILIGFIFSDQFEAVAQYAERLGTWLLVVLVGGLAAYIGLKYVQRRRFIRKLRVARITPQELNERIGRGEEIVVVDLRSSIDFEADPRTIPGAIRMATDQIEQNHDQIPRDRDVILFCT